MEVARRMGQKISFENCLEEWQELSADYNKCMEKHREYRRVADNYNSLRSGSKSLIDRQLKKMKLLKATVQKFDHDDQSREILSTIHERERTLEDLSKFLPKKNGFYLNLIVGQINMTLDNTTEKFRYKDEYEKFKLYCSCVMLVFSSLLLVVPAHRIFDALFSFLLLWYYCTLTVRESILIVNGSRIKGWWVLHHYVSVGLCGINVLWSDGDAYKEFRPLFMAFSVYQSLVQLMQYYYQRGCLYRLRALGQRHDMDITVEGFQSWMWRGLTFLLPFLFLGHAWQLYNAYALMVIALRQPFDDWHVPALAMCFFVLFCGNFSTTVSVVLQKRTSDRSNTTPKKMT